MRIALLGATSQIAKDLVLSFSSRATHELLLYARRPCAVTQWLDEVGLSNRYKVADFSAFSQDESYDAILNFVGVGNPAQAAEMGASIFDVTLQYDSMALNYLRQHPDCRYVFLSSGAAYCSDFALPADENTKAVIALNNLKPHDWYSVAKLHAECRHRSLQTLPIVDIRVFNYFSHTQDLSARFFITDILRSIREGNKLITSADNIIRDYMGPEDFYRLLTCVLKAPLLNESVDCYTVAPTDKMTLLSAMSKKFGLVYEVREASVGINATGMKLNYFSKNRKAETLGYSPSKSSLASVMDEANIALSR